MHVYNNRVFIGRNIPNDIEFSPENSMLHVLPSSLSRPTYTSTNLCFQYVSSCMITSACIIYTNDFNMDIFIFLFLDILKIQIRILVSFTLSVGNPNKKEIAASCPFLYLFVWARASFSTKRIQILFHKDLPRSASIRVPHPLALSVSVTDTLVPTVD